MLHLPCEIIGEILKFLCVKDIKYLSFCNTILYNNIAEIFDEYVYTLAKRNSIKCNSLLFRIYNRGKSCNNDIRDDVLFEFKDDEFILFCLKFNPEYYGPMIVTIDRNCKYMVYDFTEEVDTIGEYTPDYWGWDDDDINKKVLRQQTQYCDYGKITSYYIETQPIYNSETSETFYNDSIKKQLLMFPQIIG